MKADARSCEVVVHASAFHDPLAGACAMVASFIGGFSRAPTLIQTIQYCAADTQLRGSEMRTKNSSGIQYSANHTRQNPIRIANSQRTVWMCADVRILGTRLFARRMPPGARSNSTWEAENAEQGESSTVRATFASLACVKSQECPQFSTALAGLRTSEVLRPEPQQEKS